MVAAVSPKRRAGAIDGFVVDVADTPGNERAFGRPGSGRSPGAFPQARVLSLCEAAALEGGAPRELSFVNTLKILRCRLPEAPRSPHGLERWYRELLAEVAEERLQPRRNRVNPRVIKRKMSNWAKKREKHRHFPQPTKTFCQSIVMLD